MGAQEGNVVAQLCKDITVKRDWDLVRLVLVKIEAAGGKQLKSADMGIYPADMVGRHMVLMNEAGLITGTAFKPMATPEHPTFFATGITFDGYDLLEKIRSDKAWQVTKEVIKEKGIDLSFEAIKAAGAIVYAKIFGA